MWPRTKVGLALLMAAFAGCREEAPAARGPERGAPAAAAESAAQDAQPTSTGTPSDVVRAVNALRRSGRVHEMLDHVAPERRAAVRDLVTAVDQLLIDNRVLQARLAELNLSASATLFDRSGMANAIDVFSMDVEVIREEIADQSARVAIRVGQRLPLAEAHLVWRDQRWLVLPDEPIRGLADELRNLGKALNRVAAAATLERMTLEQVARELEFWQRPVLERIHKLVAESKKG